MLWCSLPTVPPVGRVMGPPKAGNRSCATFTNRLQFLPIFAKFDGKGRGILAATSFFQPSARGSVFF